MGSTFTVLGNIKTTQDFSVITRVDFHQSHSHWFKARLLKPQMMHWLNGYKT